MVRSWTYGLLACTAQCDEAAGSGRLLVNAVMQPAVQHIVAAAFPGLHLGRIDEQVGGVAKSVVVKKRLIRALRNLKSTFIAVVYNAQGGGTIGDEAISACS